MGQHLQIASNQKRFKQFNRFKQLIKNRAMNKTLQGVVKDFACLSLLPEERDS